MITIGPYRFTATDAAKTVQHLDDLWEMLTEGRDAEVIAHLRPSTDGAVDDVLPAVWQALLAAGPALRAAGQLPVRAEGMVAQLNCGAGGVPKTATDSVEVGFGGVVGDVQKSRQHHGRPWQALCIWSADVIDALNTNGHRLFPGAAGENITVRGLHWPDVRPGVRLQVGEVLCEVSAYAFPCKQNTAWFRDGDFMAMWSGNGPVSRLYATVLQPGRIATGDAAILEP